MINLPTDHFSQPDVEETALLKGTSSYQSTKVNHEEDDNKASSIGKEKESIKGLTVSAYSGSLLKIFGLVFTTTAVVAAAAAYYCYYGHDVSNSNAIDSSRQSSSPVDNVPIVARPAPSYKKVGNGLCLDYVEQYYDYVEFHLAEEGSLGTMAEATDCGDLCKYRYTPWYDSVLRYLVGFQWIDQHKYCYCLYDNVRGLYANDLPEPPVDWIRPKEKWYDGSGTSLPYAVNADYSFYECYKYVGNLPNLFSKVEGNGKCLDVHGQSYDFIGFDNLGTYQNCLSKCLPLQPVRGFVGAEVDKSWNYCRCLYDTRAAIPNPPDSAYVWTDSIGTSDVANTDGSSYPDIECYAYKFFSN